MSAGYLGEASSHYITSTSILTEKPHYMMFAQPPMATDNHSVMCYLLNISHLRWEFESAFNVQPLVYTLCGLMQITSLYNNLR